MFIKISLGYTVGKISFSSLQQMHFKKLMSNYEGSSMIYTLQNKFVPTFQFTKRGETFFFGVYMNLKV